MRVLIVSQYFHPEEFRVNQLATSLRDHGHDVVVLTGQPNYPSGRLFSGHGLLGPFRERRLGIDVIRVPVFPRRAGRFRDLALNYVSFALSATLLGLPRLRGRFDACLVFCPSPITAVVPAIVYRAFLHTPVAVWLQDLWPESVIAVTRSRSRVLQGLLTRLVRWVYAHVDQLWLQSPAYAESVRAHGGRVEQLAEVPNWAEDLYDCGGWADTREPLPENALVFAGNLGRAQGVDTLVEAAAATRDATPAPHWVFVGDGPLREWIATEVRERGLSAHVTLLPRRPPEAMPAILASAAAVLVSLTDDPVFAQTVPSKLQSAMASGRPILAAVSGEAARLVEVAGCGLVCRPGDAQALAGIVRTFLDLPTAERARLGRNGHAYYRRHYTQDGVMSRIAALLERLRASGPAARRRS